MIKGEFHVVEYLGWETTYTEIVPSDRSATFNNKIINDINELNQVETQVLGTSNHCNNIL